LPDEPSDLLDPFPFPVGTSGSVTGTVGVSDAISEGTELVDGSELGTKEGSSLGISEGSSLGPLLGISLGPVDGAPEGSMLVVGAEVAGEGTFVGSSLGRLDGSLLVLGLSEGSLLGFVLGLSEGSLLGDDEGMLDGLLLVLGPSEGSLLGNDEGVSDGVSDGSSELSVLGIETGAAVPAGHDELWQKQPTLAEHAPAASQHFKLLPGPGHDIVGLHGSPARFSAAYGAGTGATSSNGNGEMNFNAWSCSAPEARLPKSSRQAGTSPIRHMLYQIFSDWYNNSGDDADNDMWRMSWRWAMRTVSWGLGV